MADMMSALFLISSFLFCQDIDAEQRQDHQYNGTGKRNDIIRYKSGNDICNDLAAELAES